MNVDDIKKIANGIRRRVLEFTIKNGGGYLSQACSSAEILATLYGEILNIGPSIAPKIPPVFTGVPSKDNKEYFSGYGYNGPKEPHLDRFFLSPVHYALVLYATLVETNRMLAEGLEMFNKDGFTVEMIGADHSPGHELMSGSLGQTISQVLGIALARKRKGETGKNWVVMSDGEFMIGQTWEAIETLSFYKVDTVNVIIDANGQSADGKIDTVNQIEPLKKRLESFGAVAVEVNGHDIQQLIDAANTPHESKPLFVIARTIPYQGIEILKKRAPKFHYIRITNEQEKEELQQFLKERFGGDNR
ncbi:transketolase [Thermotoga profunda]|uniref:transketolase n=1 Tax=Thermotoga profunda TaxID=1508420 RepID=UPI000597AE58|nr:1-deoxy-D-xylulose-5-phosphate synthase N-terminal domain-containing protein [Thermotoga profunda]